MKFARLFRKMQALVLASAMVASIFSPQIVSAYTQGEQSQEPWLLSKGRQTYASSENGTGEPAIYATDGKMTTKWQAARGINNQWITVDLGATADVSQIIIRWQGTGDYAQDLEVLVSEDEIEWNSLYRNRNNTGGETTKVYKKEDPTKVDYTYMCQELDVEGKGRYVKILGRKGASSYGIAIRELEIYGVGGTNQPEVERNNLSLGKPTTASSYVATWNKDRLPSYATDGEENEYWVSDKNNDEWLQVDLEDVYKIGKIELQWQDKYGRLFEIQTSLDGENWDTLYRETAGLGEDLVFNCYKDARYVRMQGVAMRDNGYSIKIFNVFEYVEGESKDNPEIKEFTDREVVTVGEGSYLIDNTLHQPREPKYVTSNISIPIPSNDWWTSVVYKRYSDSLVALPLVYNYSSAGLSMYCSDKTYTGSNSGNMGAQSKLKDITVGTSAITQTPSARLDAYGDWSTTIRFSDDDTDKMRSTLIQGSPFVYNTFADPSSADITVCNLQRIYDGNGNEILKKDGDRIVTDHIGIENTNKSKSEESGDDINQTHYYGVFAPRGTTFIRSGGKIKIILGNNEDYLTIGVMTDSDDLSYMYKYAYSIVTDTVVKYNYDEASSNISTTFKYVIDQKRAGASFKNSTLTYLYPHQWKSYSGATTKRTMDSIRGTLKQIEGKKFTITKRFTGIVPSFTEPIESGYYDKDKLYEYIEIVEKGANFTSYWTADPYWQGKKTHKLTMIALIAQELGDYDLRDRSLGILKKILQNWLTYDGEGDTPFYMYYHTNWGAMSGDGGDHGMAKNLTDHHFLWAYYIYPAAVLASYDSQFVEDYGEMLEMLIRDCMNPDKDDEMFPFMRNFSPYEGHSWAGGYGDNSSGNNQESSSEGTFAWAGLYLWGLVTNQDKYRDAGIWGYTSEVSAIEQYWFDYDDDVWDEDYTHGAVGMVWGTAYTYGTYFGTKPSYIYGIQMLPVTPTLCYFGEKKDKAKKVWEEFCDDQDVYEDNLTTEESDTFGWRHIMWPFWAQSDPDAAAQCWQEQEAEVEISDDERFNSYWFIQNMCAKGTPSTDVWSSNYTSYQIFEKDGKYNATVWNPYDYEINVKFSDSTGEIGSVRVAANSTVNVDPYKVTDYSNADIPDVKDIEVTHNIPGLIQAEDYYTNYSCSKQITSEVGEYVGYIDDNDYTVYQVNVDETADYVIEYNVKNGSTKENQAIVLKSDKNWQEDLANTVIEKDNTWHIVSDTVHLSQGPQKIKLLYKGGGYHLDYIRLYKVGTKPPATDGLSPVKADLTGATLLSQNAMATATSYKGNSVAGNVTDGNYKSRWESEYADPQSITIDLGAVQKIGGIKLYWEAAAAKDYTIQISNTGEEDDFTTVFTRVNGDGGNKYGDENVTTGLESIKLDNIKSARYIRMYGTVRKTGYGYSLYEFQIYGPTPDQKEALNTPVLSAQKTGADNDNILLTWNSIDGAGSYQIYRQEKNETKKSLLATVNTNSYTDKELSNGEYSYWVVAMPQSESYMESDYSKDIESIVINNNFPVTSVTLDKTKGTMNAGDTVNLVATILPAKATDKTITWTSANRDVATVRKGVVRGVSNGTTTITATATSGKKAIYTVTVKGSVYDKETTTPEPEETTKYIEPEDPIIPEETTTAISKSQVPENLKIQIDGSKSTITWDKVNNATNYNIYSAETRYGDYKKIGTTSNTTYTDNGNACYKVAAVISGTEGQKSEAISEEIQLFGKNVYIFDQRDNAEQIQNIVYDTYDQQEAAQFGDDRIAFLFKPGTYSTSVDVGFYTEVLGLGMKPTDTNLALLRCGAWWMPMENGHVGFNATCNFWRSAANFEVNNNVMWATSQAVSLRRMKINGNLALHHSGGWSSGGFLADSVITGTTESGSQQQWLTRNTSWNQWKGENWNMVFVGIEEGKAPTGTWPEHAYTTVEKTPEVREKPFLVYDNNEYSVFVPSLQKDRQGVSWLEDNTPGTKISLDEFYVAKSDVDNADTINEALASGKHLLLTPGIYNIDKPIKVTNKDTIVLGIGLATLNASNGNKCMEVADVDGVSISGILFDTGSDESEVLLQIGDEKTDVSHEENPITISDVYCRIGGARLGRAETSLVVNSNNVIGDNLWIWRADHGTGAKWSKNTARNGVVVNGDNVTMYALMVEHYQEYQTIWNGEGGKVYFYQSEIPYDVPSQSVWKSNDGTKNGYASYKVADNVTSHEAWGLGIYSYHRDAEVELYNAVEVPELSSVVIHNACSVMLAGNPGITHVVNDCGDAVKTAGERAIVLDYSGNVLQPEITPASGFYNADKTVVITTGTEGADIYYTTDGTTPSKTNGTLYTEPFKVTTGFNTIKAIAVKEGKTDSYVTTEEIVVGNILLGKEATASSVTGNDKASKAIDGNPSTRWQSVFKEDPSWLQVDLGKEYTLDSFSITWQNAAAKVWALQVSNDGENWTDIFTENNGKAGAVITGQKIDYDGTARYVRVYGTERTASNYGYSIYEFAVYGTPTDGKVVCDAPDRVKGTAGDGFVTISWDPVKAADGYNVYRAKSNGVFKKINTELITDTTYTDSSIGEELYSYKVTAVNDLGESERSSTYSTFDFRPLEPEKPEEPETDDPDEPDDPDAPDTPGETESESPGVTKPGTPGETTKGDVQTEVPTTGGVNKETTTNKKPLITTVNKVQKVKRPSRVKKLTVKKKGKVYLAKWKVNPKAQKVKFYQIKYSTNKKFKKAKTKVISAKKYNKVKKYKLKKLKKGKKYFVKVRACRVVGKVKIYGKWSKRKSIRVK